MRQVHLCDPQLQGVGGHYLNHDSQLTRELQSRGIAVQVYARADCSVQCQGVQPKSVFSLDIFQEACADPLVWPMENFHAINRVFFSDLMKMPLNEFSPEDLVYFPNLLQNQFHAITLWLEQMPAARRPAVAVMLRWLNYDMPYMQARQNRQMIQLYYRYAAHQLRAVQPRSLICADTAELANAYTQAIGLPVLELPNPMDVAELTQRLPQRPPSSAPTVVYQGHTSDLRGFCFLPEIIAHCTSRNPIVRFKVQVQAGKNPAPPLQGTISELEAMTGPRLGLVHGALSADDYFGLLDEADIILLPYSPEFYGHGSSGVFTEAASVGKVVVVSPNTMPARQAREYGLGVVVAESWTAPAMASAVEQALMRLPELRKLAGDGAAKFRRDNSAAAFWDKLFAHLPAA